MTIIQAMTLIGLFGVAAHLGFYWAAAGLVALFVLIIWAKRRRTAALLRRRE